MSHPTLSNAIQLVKAQQGLCKAIARHNPELYTTVCPVAKGSIGGHVRHCIDHFDRWVYAVQNPLYDVIDYDKRNRDTPVEKSALGGLKALDSLIDQMEKMESNPETLDQLDKAPVKTKFMISGNGDEAVFESTLLRELWFVTHHAIHHNSTIKNILVVCGQSDPELMDSIPKDFALAPSTANYEKK